MMAVRFTTRVAALIGAISMKLDRLDARILAALQQDGRRSVVGTSEQVGLSGTPCARRIKLLEQAGVIQGYAAIVDPARLGLNVQAFVEVKPRAAHGRACRAVQARSRARSTPS